MSLNQRHGLLGMSDSTKNEANKIPKWWHVPEDYTWPPGQIRTINGSEKNLFKVKKLTQFLMLLNILRRNFLGCQCEVISVMYNGKQTKTQENYQL